MSDIIVKEFEPNKEQQLAKSRLMKYLDSNSALVALEDMSLEAIVAASKCQNIRRWITNPEFANWLYDRDSLGSKVAAYSEMAVERLYEIITSPLSNDKEAPVSTKDVLAAARMLMELADRFPKGKEKLVFIDKEVNKMDEQEVQKQISELKMKVLK